jgi:hypothetical protein
MAPKHSKRYVSDLSVNEKVLMAIVRTAETFKRTHAAIFRRHGLSFPQYNVLRVLDASQDGRNKISDNSNHEKRRIPAPPQKIIMALKEKEK